MDADSMSSPTGARRGTSLALVVALVTLVPIAYLFVLAERGSRLIKLGLPAPGTSLAVRDPRVWLAVAALGAIGALLAVVASDWRGRRLARDRDAALLAQRAADERARTAERALDRTAEDRAQAIAEVDRLTQERDRLRHEQESLTEAHDALVAARDHLTEERDAATRESEAQRQARDDLAQAWHRERSWNRRLREHIGELQRARGLLGRHEDIHATILELTLSLVEAEKGVLLSPRDGSSRDLAVVCHTGFEHDPRESALAHRFAGEVLARDTIIREDDRGAITRSGERPADEEVRNLLAIPIYIADDFTGVIVCANREGGFEELEEEVLVAVGDQAGAVMQNGRLHGELRAAYLRTIAVLASAIELKDPELRGHSDAVSEYVLAVADQLDFTPERRESLIYASLLHDVGKLGISERILLKPAALTDDERAVIQLHPRLGYQLVSQVPALRDIAPAVLHHHERFDGTGYPSGLRAHAIPLEARIITIADAFSAMTSIRPYSAARSATAACAELERCAGEQFDPEIVPLFVDAVRANPPREPAHRPVPHHSEIDVHRVADEFVLGGGAFGITDSLTLLYGHRHFHETIQARAQQAALRSWPFSIVLARLVDLGDINRKHGYAAGDAALQSLASSTQGVASEMGGLAFRASGDTIGLVLDGARIDSTLLARIESDDVVRIRAAAVTWQPGENGDGLFRRADALLASAS